MTHTRPILLALLIGLTGPAALAERVPPRVMPLADDASGRVIVKFRQAAPLVRAHALSATSSTAAVATALEARSAALGTRHGLRLRAGAALTERVQVVQAEGVDARTLAARLAADPDVEYAEPDRRMRRRLVPNDPRFASVAGSGPAVGQWYLKTPAGEVASSIDAVSAWDTTTGSAAVVVAVLDSTGVRYDHPDLAGKLLPGYDMVSDSAISNDGDGRDADASDPGDFVTSAEAAVEPFLASQCEVSPSSWHGTQVAGIVGAATGNGTGMAGAGWNVRVLPVRVLGKCFGYTSDIIAAMRWAAGLSVPGVPDNPNRAQVINLSLGSADPCSTLERDTIAEINGVGTVVVAAAGNSAGLAAGSPASCVGAIGVAALRHVGTKVGFSDVGPETLDRRAGRQLRQPQWRLPVSDPDDHRQRQHGPGVIDLYRQLQHAQRRYQFLVAAGRCHRGPDALGAAGLDASGRARGDAGRGATVPEQWRGRRPEPDRRLPRAQHDRAIAVLLHRLPPAARACSTRVRRCGPRPACAS